MQMKNYFLFRSNLDEIEGNLIKGFLESKSIPCALTVRVKVGVSFGRNTCELRVEDKNVEQAERLLKTFSKKNPRKSSLIPIAVRIILSILIILFAVIYFTTKIKYN